MGDTLPLRRRGHALEGVSRHGRTRSLCGPPARRREDGGRYARTSGSPGRRATRSINATRRSASKGLTDRSRRPHRHANQLPMVVEKAIVRLKQDYPSWGAPKIRERLKQKLPDVGCPAISTVHAVLDRHGLVQRRRRRVRPRLTGTTLSQPLAPNVLWCADYKGEFLLSQSPLLLSPHDHGLCHALSSRLRGAVDDEGTLCLRRLRARLPGVRSAARYSHGQRRALCLGACALRAQQAVGVVAAAWHSPRAHHARPSGTKRPTRAHAPDVKNRSDPAGLHERAPTARPF